MSKRGKQKRLARITALTSRHLPAEVDVEERLPDKPETDIRVRGEQRVERGAPFEVQAYGALCRRVEATEAEIVQLREERRAIRADHGQWIHLSAVIRHCYRRLELYESSRLELEIAYRRRKRLFAAKRRLLKTPYDPAIWRL